VTDEVGRLTVTRNAPNDVKVRQIVLSLDGDPLATLLYGESVTREVVVGAHSLRAHNTLVWKTVDFEIAAGEHVHFRVVNRPGFGTYAMLSLLGTGPIYLTLERVDAGSDLDLCTTVAY
jgi:hypothetical protein